jgi:hypothetical protein
MMFTVVSEHADKSLSESYPKPRDAYTKAREYEAEGVRVKIRLPTGHEVPAEEFGELYLLKDAD